ncbi:MAG: LysR family transcriptional regulator, partial [Muribaculaceae bacterium]
MTLQQLEYVVAVDKCHHFARAAEECGVTQPTLSTMLAKLEAELGVKLFVRSKSQVVTTDVGQLIVRQAQKVLDASRRIPQIAEESRGSLSGTFRIGILPTVAPYLLPLFFPQLLREHPEMGVRVVEMRTAEVRRALDAGDIDAAIVVRLQELESYNLTTLYYEQFLAYV